MKTTILLKKTGFQSQIEFAQKSIVRLNFFNRGAFGNPCGKSRHVWNRTDRYLPPGTMMEYFEQFQALEGLPFISFSTFWRTWRVEFDHLRFRSTSSHSQCSCCVHHRVLLKELSPYGRNHQAALCRAHLVSQCRDIGSFIGAYAAPAASKQLAIFALCRMEWISGNSAFQDRI